MSVVSPTVTITIHAVPISSLTLVVDKTAGYLGAVFSFSGVEMQNGTPVSGATINLFRNGVVVGNGVTDVAGNYVIPWTADVEGILSFYTEAPQPPLPPLRSPTLGLGIGLEVPMLTQVVAPFAIAIIVLAFILRR